jgi:hypothetical protein
VSIHSRIKDFIDTLTVREAPVVRVS